MTAANAHPDLAASNRDRRDAIGRDLALAHASLRELIAAVHHRDLPGVRAALDTMHELGICVDATGLTECIDGMSQRTTLGIDAVEEMLPTLVGVWETAQQGIVDRAFASGNAPLKPTDGIMSHVKVPGGMRRGTVLIDRNVHVGRAPKFVGGFMVPAERQTALGEHRRVDEFDSAGATDRAGAAGPG